MVVLTLVAAVRGRLEVPPVKDWPSARHALQQVGRFRCCAAAGGCRCAVCDLCTSLQYRNAGGVNQASCGWVPA